METSEIQRNFRHKVCEEIEIETEDIDKFRIFSPFTFRDGDHFSIVLRKENDSWLLSDEGSTYMHLSILGVPEKSLQFGTRKEIVLSTLEDFGVEDRQGELIIRIKDEEYGDALYRFAQALLKISDLTYLSKKLQKNRFLKDFKDLIIEAVPKERCEFDWYDKERDPKGKYVVDCRVNNIERPLTIFALQTDSKIRDATITIYQFQTWNIPFFPIGIFKDMEESGKKATAKFADVCEKLYSNIEEEENRGRIIEYIREMANAETN
jgi:hypothetical protein